MTFHSSKGLEYEQVIIFGEDYSEIESKIYNHYVAVTRAKEKLIIVVAKYIFVCENMLAGPSKHKFLIIRNRVEYIWTSLMVFLAMAKTTQTKK